MFPSSNQDKQTKALTAAVIAHFLIQEQCLLCFQLTKNVSPSLNCRRARNGSDFIPLFGTLDCIGVAMMAPAAAKDLECPEHQHAQQQQKPQRRRRTVVGSLVTAALAISGVALLVSNSTSTTSYPGLHALSTYELKEGEALIHTGDGEHIVSTQEHARKLRGGLTVGCAQSNWKSIFARQAETGAQYQSELIYQGVRSLSYQWQVRPVSYSAAAAAGTTAMHHAMH
jgi:hypothetical protein